VRGVRELADLRLLIADYIENRVVLANFTFFGSIRRRFNGLIGTR
jgi:hypothetical protein